MRPQSRLTPEFSFAGFQWPRYVADLPIGHAALRRKWEGRKFTGGYYHKPPPNNTKGRGFYLDDAGQPFSRWRWADDVIDLRHTGWWADSYQDTKIRGIVAILPHNRFMAGWAMGEGMIAEVDASIYDTPEDAAHAADSMAQYAAESMLEDEANRTEEDDE